MSNNFINNSKQFISAMKLEYINIYYYTNIPVYISIQGVSIRVGIEQVKLTL